MKKCCMCKQTKKFSSFYKHNKKKDGYQNYCIECGIKRTSEFKEEVRRQLRAYVKEHGCCGCGETEYVTIDFHHIDPAIKELGISILIDRNSFKRLQEEINKCAILCSNCHRKYHAGLLPDIVLVPCDLIFDTSSRLYLVSKKLPSQGSDLG